MNRAIERTFNEGIGSSSIEKVKNALFSVLDFHIMESNRRVNNLEKRIETLEKENRESKEKLGRLEEIIGNLKCGQKN